MLVIARAVVWLSAIGGRFQFFGKSGRRLTPSEVTFG